MPLSAFYRAAQGLPPVPDRAERERTAKWVRKSELQRRFRELDQKVRELRERPAQRDAQIAAYRAMELDPASQAIRAAAARQRAQRDVRLARMAADAAARRASEERAKETMRTEYGYDPAAGAPVGRDAVRARWAALGVPLRAADCSYLHPHSGPCQPRTAGLCRTG
jgi:hypothetical protein